MCENKSFYLTLRDTVTNFLDTNPSYVPSMSTPLIVSVENKENNTKQLGLMWSFIDKEFYDLANIFQVFNPESSLENPESKMGRFTDFYGCFVDFLCEFNVVDDFYSNQKYEIKVLKSQDNNFEMLLPKAKKNSSKIFETICKLG